MKQKMFIVVAALVAASVGGCTKHEIDSRHEVQMAPIEVKPIHITIDVNIRVDKALDDFFGDLDEAANGEDK